jgi:hypothetical protein
MEDDMARKPERIMGMLREFEVGLRKARRLEPFAAR